MTWGAMATLKVPLVHLFTCHLVSHIGCDQIELYHSLMVCVCVRACVRACVASDQGSGLVYLRRNRCEPCL